MPELPEVETVRRGLSPALTGAIVERVQLNRPDLRFPFPDGFADRLKGQKILEVGRRAKFLMMPLSSGELITAHLGMTGRFSVLDGNRTVEPGAFYDPAPASGHEHAVFFLKREDGVPVKLTYSDPRRFGFFELFAAEDRATAARFADLGPEPLSEDFTPEALQQRLAGKAAPLKAALLDQRIVAGLGNIYVCEALFRAGLSPRRKSATIGPARAERLAASIKGVLSEAIRAGGSTLQDYAAVDGTEGSFQQQFDVYDRAGEPCRVCGKAVERFVQSGRSSFACGGCQR